MGQAVADRFEHYTVEPNVDDFCAYAYQTGCDASIPSFLRYRPNLLHDADTQEKAFPTPRSWIRLNRKLPHLADEFHGIAASIGDGAAGEFIAHRKIFHELPDIDQIIRSPGSVRVPQSASTLYAVAGALSARANQQDIKPIVTYLRRLPPEYQVVAIKDIIGKDRSLITEPAVQSWTTDNASIVF